MRGTVFHHQASSSFATRVPSRNRDSVTIHPTPIQLPLHPVLPPSALPYLGRLLTACALALLLNLVNTAFSRRTSEVRRPDSESQLHS